MKIAEHKAAFMAEDFNDLLDSVKKEKNCFPRNLKLIGLVAPYMSGLLLRPKRADNLFCVENGGTDSKVEKENKTEKTPSHEPETYLNRTYQKWNEFVNNMNSESKDEQKIEVFWIFVHLKSSKNSN